MIAPYNCVVVANGRFPQTALPLHLLHQASVVIACDGAVEALDKAGITPTAIVGDLDSIPSRFREQYADRIHIVEDQEINDLTKSVRFAHRSGQQEVLILGATGLREDHTLLLHSGDGQQTLIKVHVGLEIEVTGRIDVIIAVSDSVSGAGAAVMSLEIGEIDQTALTV